MTKHKPKVWNIAVLTAMTAVIAAVLLLTGEEDHTLALYILMDVYLAAVIILLIRAFF